MNVLYVALSTSRLMQVVRDVQFVVDAGGSATVVTTKPDAWPALPGNARIMGLAEAESAHWLLRGERLLVFRLPSLSLRLIRKLMVLLAKLLPGPLGRPFVAGRNRVDRLLVAQRRRATRFHKERFGKFYRNIRPFVLWQAARRRVLANMDLTDFDAVVIGDSLSTTVGWHIAKSHPSLDVSFSLLRDRVADDDEVA